MCEECAMWTTAVVFSTIQLFQTSNYKQACQYFGVFFFIRLSKNTDERKCYIRRGFFLDHRTIKDRGVVLKGENFR